MEKKLWKLSTDSYNDNIYVIADNASQAIDKFVDSEKITRTLASINEVLLVSTHVID